MKCIDGNYEVLLIGDSQDRDLCSRIAAGARGRCLNAAGETTLRQSVELLRRCELLVTNDSAPTHLGTAAEIRVLTLFGSTVPEFGFAPYGSKGRALGIDLECRPCTDHGRRSCPQRHFRCLTDLAPQRVFDEIVLMLSSGSP
jgi:heptosyltransferase-2